MSQEQQQQTSQEEQQQQTSQEQQQQQTSQEKTPPQAPKKPSIWLRILTRIGIGIGEAKFGGRE